MRYSRKLDLGGESTIKNKDPRAALRFVLPSLLGVLIFLTPIRWNGELTIGIGVITGNVLALMGEYGLPVVVVIMTISSALTVVATLFRAQWIRNNEWLASIFDVPMSWLLIRLTGAVFGIMYLFQFGPALILSDGVGGAVFDGIAVNVLAVYISACLLLPLLTDFGFMEYVGTLARPLFRSVFRLPGRAAIDATASFVGASAIGLLITIGQYERRYYTQREAAVIAANFSVVSIPFSLVVAKVSGIGHLFVSWYGVVVLTCIAAAIITPRLPPLSRKKDEFLDGATGDSLRHEEPGQVLLAEAWHAAIERAEKSGGLVRFLTNGLRNLLFFLFSVVAATMALATLAALLTFHTPVFEWLGWPLAVVLDAAGLPETATAAPGLFAGFMDQYMPAVVAIGIDSETTSFLLAGLSVCQLVFMSEVGVLILRSKLPLGFVDLFVIFLLRTAIALPPLFAGAMLFAR